MTLCVAVAHSLSSLGCVPLRDHSTGSLPVLLWVDVRAVSTWSAALPASTLLPPLPPAPTGAAALGGPAALPLVEPFSAIEFGMSTSPPALPKQPRTAWSMARALPHEACALVGVVCAGAGSAGSTLSFYRWGNRPREGNGLSLRLPRPSVTQGGHRARQREEQRKSILGTYSISGPSWVLCHLL